ncbi:MAG: sensor histidine kinase [Planctomycetota bacterium]
MITERQQQKENSEGKRSSLKITFIYFLFGSLWIVFSDRILAAFVSDPQTMTAIQTYKGWFYVLATAVLVYLLVSGMERRLRRLMDDLEQKNKELERIIYVSSHDLRSPLVNVQGFAGELTKSLKRLDASIMACPQAASDEQVLNLIRQDIPESVHFIKTGADKLSQLQQGLLDVCRLGYEPFNLQGVDMNELLDRAVGSLKFQADECGATIELENLPDCRADEAKLLQVFVNLIGNALKYRDPQRPAQISISGRHSDHVAHYRVADNGIGIDPMYHGKIFDMYHQLDPDREGQGLGLTIVKRILDRMDGTVTVESEPGKGTTLTLTLPVK